MSKIAFCWLMKHAPFKTGDAEGKYYLDWEILFVLDTMPDAVAEYIRATDECGFDYYKIIPYKDNIFLCVDSRTFDAEICCFAEMQQSDRGYYAVLPDTDRLLIDVYDALPSTREEYEAISDA